MLILIHMVLSTYVDDFHGSMWCINRMYITDVYSHPPVFPEKRIVFPEKGLYFLYLAYGRQSTLYVD